jgi:hypothetical protein
MYCARLIGPLGNSPRRLSENGYFPQSLHQAQIIILEILQCIPVVIIFVFLDLGKNISFSVILLGSILRKHEVNTDTRKGVAASTPIEAWNYYTPQL